VNQLELTVSLVFALFLWNWRDILPGAELMNVSPKDSSIAHLDVTYVPDAALSDEKSWSAWQTNASRSNTTEAYVKPASQSADNGSTPSTNTNNVNPNGDRHHSVPVGPTQDHWKGESWADGILIEDPDAKTSPESHGAVNGSNSSPENAEFVPNILPNFWEEGSRSEPTQKPQSAFPQLSPQPNSSSKNQMTVVPVAVTVASPSPSSRAITTTDSSLDLKDSASRDTFPWGVLLPSCVGGFGVAGIGYFLLQRRDRHSKAEFSGPPCK
jgi:hypothetical protein